MVQMFSSRSIYVISTFFLIHIKPSKINEWVKTFFLNVRQRSYLQKKKSENEHKKELPIESF